MESTQRINLLQRFFQWRERYLTDRQFLLILSFIIGVCTALAGYTLKHLVEYIKELLTQGFDVTGVNWLYLVYPALGILITGLVVRYIIRDDISHGITKILYAISRRQSRIKRHNVWSSIMASSITIGFGGSVGAEAPIVLTGSAIGSNLGSLFRLDHRTLMLLVGCGAAGAVAGIFKAPIAGLVFTIEVIMIDLTMASLLPLLISSVTAASVSYLLSGSEAMFAFRMDEPFLLERIPHAIVLGMVCGIIALYFIHSMNWFEDVFRKYTNPYVKFLIGGTVLSVLIFFFPSLYGEGYDTIHILINGSTQAEWDAVMDGSLFYGNASWLVLYLILVIVFKSFATSATNGGGGCGGTFAPTLFLGSVVGFVFAYLSNLFQIGNTYLPNKNFALMGMAGLMSAVMHAPLTGVFLIAELTGGYDLFLPLLIVSVSSYLTIMMFEPHSIYAMRLAKRGELVTHHKDKSVLLLMNIEDIIETDFLSVRPQMDLGEMVNVVSRSKRNLFPVLNAQEELVGVVVLDDIRNIMFRHELYHRFHVERFMTAPKVRIYTTDSVEVIMRKFDDTAAWNLPVVDESNRYKGFISKSKMLNTYRQVLVDFSAE